MTYMASKNIDLLTVQTGDRKYRDGPSEEALELKEHLTQPELCQGTATEAAEKGSAPGEMPEKHT